MTTKDNGEKADDEKGNGKNRKAAVQNNSHINNRHIRVVVVVSQGSGVLGGSSGVSGGLGGVEEGEEDAAEGDFAAGWVVPLLEGVDAAAEAAAANGYGGDSAGERDVGVGGAEAEFGAEGEVAVDGAEGVE